MADLFNFDNACSIYDRTSRILRFPNPFQHAVLFLVDGSHHEVLPVFELAVKMGDKSTTLLPNGLLGVRVFIKPPENLNADRKFYFHLNN